MTTIAYKLGVGIAADRMVTAGDDIMPPRAKVFEIGHYVFGACGYLGPAFDAMLMLQDWLAHNPLDVGVNELMIRRQLQPFFAVLREWIKELPPENECGFDVVLIDKRCPYVVLSFSRSAHLVSYIDVSSGHQIEAWGSGADVAKGALMAGASPEDAVRIAATLTTGTSHASNFISIPTPGAPA
jgi:hypothetical protein